MSIGDIRKWSWDFGNGNTSVVGVSRVQTYPTTRSDYTVPIRLEVENDIGCKDTIVQNITILWNCYIAVPSAFTPNRDGLNDFLYPLNAYKATKLQFSVYNRFGQRVFLPATGPKNGMEALKANRLIREPMCGCYLIRTMKPSKK